MLTVALLLLGCGKQENTLSDTHSQLEPNSNATFTAWNGECNPRLNEHGYYEPSDFRTALICSMDLLEWPASYRPDAVLIETGIMLDPLWSQTIYPPEMVLTTITGTYGRCAWLTEWMSAYSQGDPEQAAHALEHYELYTVKVTDSVPGYPADGLDISILNADRNMIEKARVGDPSGLINEFNASCGYIPWPSPQ